MVQIENRMERPLPAFASELLEAMFADYRTVVVKAEFTSGLSGSRVFLVRPIGVGGPELPSIVKIDHVATIKREWEAYKECIRYRLPGVAEVRGEPVYPPGSAWGGLWYPLAGAGTFDVVSLHHYCRQATVDDIRYVLEERLGKSLEMLWKQAQPRAEFHVQTFYDAFLPVNLVIESAQPPPGAAVGWLHPETIHHQAYTAGDYVNVTGFRVERIAPAQQRLSLDIPAGQAAAYRLHWQGVADIDTYRVGQTIYQPLTGIVKQTRHDQLVVQARQALGSGVDVTAETLTLPNGVRLPNPLLTLPRLLNKTFDTRIACIHGDLNLENVLVEPGNRSVHLIDFAKSRQDHVLRDLLHLEMAVVTKLLPEALAQAILAPELIVPFYERLHCAVLHPGQFTPPAGLEKPFAILQTIRQVARRHLFEADDWAEYYTGLTIYLLGALKFGDLDKAPTAPRPKQVAFWGAAVVQKLLQVKPVCEEAVKAPVVTDNSHLTQEQALPAHLDARRLYPIVSRYFNESELRDLCLTLDIDFENLPGGGKADKARELVLYCERHGLTSELIKACWQWRPHAFQ